MYGGYYNMGGAQSPTGLPAYTRPPMMQNYSNLQWPSAPGRGGGGYAAGGRYGAARGMAPLNTPGRVGHPAAASHPSPPPPPPASKQIPPVHQLQRGSSFVMAHNGGSFRHQPYNANLTGGSLYPHYGSFSSNPMRHGSGFGGTNGSFRSANGSFRSLSNGSLQRVNSGVDFDYSINGFNQSQRDPSRMSSMRSFTSQPPSRTGSFTSVFGGSRPGSAAGEAYSYEGTPTVDDEARGARGIGSAVSEHSFASSSTDAETDPRSEPPTLKRGDSSASLQRHYSIAGQYHQFGGGAGAELYPNVSRDAAAPQPQRMAYPASAKVPPPSQSMMLSLQGSNAMVRGMNPPFMRGRGRAGGMSAAGRQPPPQQQQQQRRLGASGEVMRRGTAPGDDAAPEGTPQLLGRKNSTNHLARKESQKRIGMYFKNKEASDAEGVQYKKEGDTGTSKAGARGADPSLMNPIRAIVLLDKTGNNPDLEVDGRTVRAMKPSQDEVQKYDMRDVIYVNPQVDVEVNGDALDEIRDAFVYGCNVGMIMADGDCPAKMPTRWFSWLALKKVVKNTFANLSSDSEFTVSVCLLQDDQMMDLLADAPRRFVTLTVAESPLFGNIANGVVNICIDDAGEFNDTLDACLSRAQTQCLDNNSEEQGIIVVTCILKQTKKSSSTGKTDVVVSSLFASGVGSGVIHYTRILDKNPAEPRALFYSVLHRSVHSAAIFSFSDTCPELLNYLSTLQRFSKINTRKPKIGSVRAFLAYANSTIPKVKEDLKGMKNGKQRAVAQRFLERMKLMSIDAADMLENPADAVPKTYI